MKAKKRQKMCYNCEGEVDLDVIVCPFCAADLRSEKPEQQGSGFQSSFVQNMNTQQSLYPPHYVPKNSSESEGEEEIEPSPHLDGQIVDEEDEPKGVIIPTILMTLGAQLLLFGLFMGIFSHQGSFVLKWDARLWFVYIFVSIPLLAFGYKSVSKL